MIKKIFLFLLILSTSLNNISVEAEGREIGNPDIKNGLINLSGEDNIVNVDSENGISVLTSIMTWAKDGLTSLLVLIAIGAFLFVGVRLAMARGNPEEFKKAITQLVYAIIGIFIVSVAWALVTLVAGLTF